MKNLSTTTNIHFITLFLTATDNNSHFDVINTDFSTAVDLINQKILQERIVKLGFGDALIYFLKTTYLENCL